MVAHLQSRATEAELRVATRVLLEQCPVLPGILESVPDPAGVFNEHRQLLLCNRAFQRARVDEVSAVGRRPGEVLGCVNAPVGPDGCGTSPACATCGSLRVLTDSLDRSMTSAGECRIRTQSGSSSDFFVRASPLHFGSTTVAMAVFRDAGSDKRREVLERSFFHDLLNTASDIAGIAGVLADPKLTQDESEFFRQQLSSLATHLVEEIRAQRRIAEAEAGNMLVRPSMVNVRELLTSVLAAQRADLPNRAVDTGSMPDICILADVVILQRILATLIRNAMEAAGPGERVTVWCDAEEETVSFRIHRQSGHRTAPDAKPEASHAAGSYSAKLFTERYLGGRLTCVSEPNGTLFSVTLPLHNL